MCHACLNKTKVLKRLFLTDATILGQALPRAMLMLTTIAIGLTIPYLSKPFMDNLFGRHVSLPLLLQIPASQKSRRPGNDRRDLCRRIHSVLGGGHSSGPTLAWARSRLTLDVRVQLYQTLQRSASITFDKRQVGSIMARVTQDTSALNSFMNNTLSSYLQDHSCSSAPW